MKNVFQREMQVFEIIKYLDIFGKKIEFTIDNSIRSKTVIGGLFSILSVCLIVVYTLYISQDFLYHKNPSVFVINNHLSKALKIEDPLNKIPLILSFRKDNHNFKVLDFFDITCFYYEYSRLNNTILKKNNISLYKCNKQNIEDLINYKMDDDFFEDAYCLSNDNKSYILYGSTSSDLVGYFNIQLTYKFKEYTNNQELIDEIYYNFTFFKLTVINSDIFLYNYYNPIIYYPISYELLLSPHFTKYMELSVKKNTLDSDDGIMFSNIKSYDSYSIGNDYFYFSVDMDDYKMCQFSIYSSNINDYSKRKYIRIQNIFSDLGGIINLIANVMPFTVAFYSSIQRDQFILTRFVQNLDKYSDKYKIKQKQIRTKRIKIIAKKYNNSQSMDGLLNINRDNNFRLKKNLIKKNQLTLSNNEKMNINNSLIKIYSKKKIVLNKEINKFLKNHNENRYLYFNWYEIIKLSFCCNKFLNQNLYNKKILYNYSKHFVTFYLEFLTYINKMQEFNKLKFMIFDKYQLSLFKFCPNEILSLKNGKFSNNLMRKSNISYYNDKEVAKYAINYLKTIKKSNNANLTDIDKRVLLFLNDNK